MGRWRRLLVGYEGWALERRREDLLSRASRSDTIDLSCGFEA